MHLRDWQDHLNLRYTNATHYKTNVCSVLCAKMLDCSSTYYSREPEQLTLQIFNAKPLQTTVR